MGKNIFMLSCLTFACEISSASVVVVNNCTGTGACALTGYDSGFGTSTFSIFLLASGDAGSGGGTVALQETATTPGPVRNGIIVFSYNGSPSYGETGFYGDGNGGGTAGFGVGPLQSFGLGEVGVPYPYGGQNYLFTLGVPFDITAYVGFLGGSGLSFGTGCVDISFSIYEALSPGPPGYYVPGTPVIIEDATLR